MAILRIKRSNEFANYVRKIKIFLDNKEVGAISNGETKDFEITAGIHTLQAKIDWCSSNNATFTISEIEIKAFSMSSFAKRNPLGILAAIYYMTFGAGKYLNLEEETG